MRIWHSPEDIRVRDGIPQADHRPSVTLEAKEGNPVVGSFLILHLLMVVVIPAREEIFYKKKRRPKGLTTDTEAAQRHEARGARDEPGET
jgi:hypothetical protein